jgi:hypothetical protein
VLGVAGLVAILSRVSPADPLVAYRHGVVLIIGFFIAAAVVSAVLLTGRPVVASDAELAASAVLASASADGAAEGPVRAAVQDG